AENASPNRVQVAFRSRIKLFYRPAKLNDNQKVVEAAEKISWSLMSDELKAINNSPYFISLVSVTLSQGNRKSSIQGEMVAPHS
ncbi:molecular chaperone, partial [Enterobacter hormaechei]|uniref:fimbrial biogenesis chaperone n=1 Tax=Enterobacter hormaechei TaxID=158836 RepID=UPI001F248D35